jgi:hypothetical protein
MLGRYNTLGPVDRAALMVSILELYHWRPKGWGSKVSHLIHFAFKKLDWRRKYIKYRYTSICVYIYVCLEIYSCVMNILKRFVKALLHVNKIKKFVTMVHQYKYYDSGHNPSSSFYLKYKVSETWFCPHLQVKPTQAQSIELLPISGHLYQHQDRVCSCAWLVYPIWCWYSRPEIGTSCIDWVQLSRFYLKTETDSSLRNILF